MQNHLDSGGRSFAVTLQSSDAFGGSSNHNDFASTSAHSNGTPGSDFGIMNSNSNLRSNHSESIMNNHVHHSNSHMDSHNVSNSNNGSCGNGNTDVKQKKPLPPNGKKTKGRVKIKMEFIDNKLRRYTTFSKRKTGIMKKAYELSTLTGTQVMLLVASETGHVYTFATRKLQPMITSEAGKALIQTCLNSPDPPHTGSDPQRMSATGYEETELTYAADPNASDQGDIRDDDSESGCSGGENIGKEVPSLLPLSSGLISPDFAALFATAAGMSSTKGGGISLSSLIQAQDQNGSNHLLPSPEALASAAHILSHSSISLTPTSASTTVTSSALSSSSNPRTHSNIASKSSKRFRSSQRGGN